MAKNVQNSHFSFARIFTLVENMSLRSSPLLEAAERYVIFLEIDNANNLVFWCRFLNKLEPWYAVYIMQQ